jgi:hypothetical protein
LRHGNAAAIARLSLSMPIVLDALSRDRCPVAEEAIRRLLAERGVGRNLHVSAFRHAGGDWTVTLFDDATGLEVADPSLHDAVLATLKELPEPARR